jgi:predicted dehydrogenase
MASKKINVGIIGTSWGADVHLPVFKTCPDFDVIAVCSARQEKADEVACQYNIQYAFSDYNQLLNLRELDLVSIVTPPYLHYPMTMAALNAGKHVLCEKPMAFDTAEAREMYRLASDLNRVHMIDFEGRFFPARMKMKKLIEKGYLGQLYQIHISRFVWGFGAAPVHRDWNWFSEESKGGGALQAEGSHYIDALRWWFGELESVCAEFDTFVKERRHPVSGDMRNVETEDAFTFIGRFQKEGMATVTLNSDSWQGSGERFEAYGSKGTLIIDNKGNLWNGRKDRGDIEIIPLPEKPVPYGIEGRRELKAFAFIAEKLVQGILEGKKVFPNFYDGMKCQEIMDAIRRSNIEKKWINIVNE